MKRLFLFVFLSTALNSTAQSVEPDEFMLWTEVSTKGKFVKNVGWSADINTRFAPGIQTFFPQVGVSAKRCTLDLKP